MITTPIFYVNAGPHIGHLYSVVLADALARWKDCTGIDRVFTTGTDEHGLKIQQAASSSSSNAKTIDFCNHVSGQFQSLFNRANIDYDAFIRTTDAQHGRAVMSLWKNLESRGMISMGEHRSWYSTSDESFLTPMQVEWDEVVGKMKSKESGHVVEQISEENYKFHLSHFRERLLQWLDDNPSLIVPASRANEVRSILEQGLSDLSISRLESKVQWAIGVPGDPDQVIYVWLDALTNYLTAAQYPHDQEYFDQVGGTHEYLNFFEYQNDKSCRTRLGLATGLSNYWQRYIEISCDLLACVSHGREFTPTAKNRRTSSLDRRWDQNVQELTKCRESTRGD